MEERNFRNLSSSRRLFIGLVASPPSGRSERDCGTGDDDDGGGGKLVRGGSCLD